MLVECRSCKFTSSLNHKNAIILSSTLPLISTRQHQHRRSWLQFRSPTFRAKKRHTLLASIVPLIHIHIDNALVRHYLVLFHHTLHLSKLLNTPERTEVVVLCGSKLLSVVDALPDPKFCFLHATCCTGCYKHNRNMQCDNNKENKGNGSSATKTRTAT